MIFPYFVKSYKVPYVISPMATRWIYLQGGPPKTIAKLTHTHTLGNPMIYGGYSELVFMGFTSQLINHKSAINPIKYLFFAV